MERHAVMRLRVIRLGPKVSRSGANERMGTFDAPLARGAVMANRLAETRVGVLGTGEVGRRLASGFHGLGHQVTIGSRDPEKPELREWLSTEGAGIQAGTFADAAGGGELLVLAVLGDVADQVIADAGRESFAGKVVIDAMNPLDFSGGFPPKLSISGEDSLGEQVQRTLPDAKIVKAFNIIGNPYFVDPRFSEGQPTMLIAGDDADAKRTVTHVLADFGWSDVVDIGGIDGSRELEAICIAWVKIGGIRGAWDHGFKLLVG
jgi:predicted dinucleotide-binding enzyme